MPGAAVDPMNLQIAAQPRHRRGLGHVPAHGLVQPLQQQRPVRHRAQRRTVDAHAVGQNDPVRPAQQRVAEPGRVSVCRPQAQPIEAAGPDQGRGPVQNLLRRRPRGLLPQPDLGGGEAPLQRLAAHRDAADRVQMHPQQKQQRQQSEPSFSLSYAQKITSDG